MKSSARSRRWSPPRSAFAGFRFPPEVIVVAVRWYLRYGLSYRDVEELLAERGVEVDHVTVYRWVQRFTPLLADAARFARHCAGRPVVRRRDLRQGQRRVALRLPGDRPVRAGHRRAGLGPPRRRCGPPVLRPGAAHVEGDADRGGHRRGAGYQSLPITTTKQGRRRSMCVLYSNERKSRQLPVLRLTKTK